MDTCKHGNTGDCALCRLEDEEHDAAMGAQASDDKGELAALRKDAERYRWLREQSPSAISAIAWRVPVACNFA